MDYENLFIERARSAERAPRRVEAPLEETCSQAEPGSASCVQRFDDSLNSAIRTTYRISLRSSSLREPRYPSTRVVCCDNSSGGRTGDARDAREDRTLETGQGPRDAHDADARGTALQRGARYGGEPRRPDGCRTSQQCLRDDATHGGGRRRAEDALR